MWACNVSPLPFLLAGLHSGKGTETLLGGKVLHRMGCTAPATHAAWVPEDMKGSNACYLLLGCSNCEEGPEFHLPSELEQPCSWLTVWGASRWIPSSSPFFCMPLCSWLHPNCHDQSQLPSRSAGMDCLPPYTAVAKRDHCAVAWWMVPLVVSAVLGAQRKLLRSSPL